MNLRVVAEITIIVTLSVTCLILLMRIFKYKRNNEMLSNDNIYLRDLFDTNMTDQELLLKNYNSAINRELITLEQLKTAQEQLAAIEKEYGIDTADVNRLTISQMTTKLAEIAVINMCSSAFLHNQISAYHPWRCS